MGKEFLEQSNLIFTLHANHKLRCFDALTLTEYLEGPLAALSGESITSFSTFSHDGKNYLIVATALKITLRVYLVTNQTLSKVFECRHASS